MKTKRKPLCLGDIVAAAVDAANKVTKNQRESSHLAAKAVRSFLVKAGRVDLARRLGTAA